MERVKASVGPEVAEQPDSLLKSVLRREPKPIPQAAIRKILSGELFPSIQGPITFDQMYRSNNRYLLSDRVDKFDVACALISDGTYAELNSLVENFTLPEDKTDPVCIALQDRLRILMVEKGKISEGSKEERLAKESFARLVLSDDDLRQLCQVLPIGFMGALARMEFYKNIEDPAERERLRAFATKSLLRPYLGNFQYFTPDGNIDFDGIIHLLPEKVFENPDAITLHLAEHYLVNQALKLFIDGEEDGFRKLREQTQGEPSHVKKRFLEQVLTDFEEARTIKVPNSFNDWVLDETSSAILGEEVHAPFPNFRQKYFLYKFLQNPQKFLCGDTGATKTACSYLGMETVGAQKVTIFGPANARETWPDQARKHFRGDTQPDVFTIETRNQLDDPRVLTAKYLYISSDLLANATHKAQKPKDSLTNEQTKEFEAREINLIRRTNELREKLIERVVIGRGTDGIILDESQAFRNPDANCAEVVTDLIKQIRENYTKNGAWGKEIPILALTATPIFSDLEDFDLPMHFLYPDKYALPGIREAEKYVFSDSCDREPEVAFIKLYGEDLLMQWTTEDMFGEKVPTLKFEDLKRISLELNPELEVIYRWLVNFTDVGVLNKFWLLRSVLINPGVIRDLNIKHQWFKPSISKDELTSLYRSFYERYQKWVQDRNPSLEMYPFSADWIALQEEGDKFILECFFHPDLIFGFESLARSQSDIEVTLNKSPSPKAEFLRKHLIKNITKDSSEGYKSKSKTVVISTEQTLGITRYLDDEDADLAINAFSLYEMVLADWLPGIPRDLAINVDGTLPFRTRRRIAEGFRQNGSQYYFVILNKESMDVSIDMAPRANMENIEEVNVVFLGLPWHWAGIKQMCGRFLRPGVGKKINFHVLEVDGTIDEGLSNLVRRTHITTQIAMAGVRLDRDDAEFYDKAKAARRIIEVSSMEGQLYLRSAIKRMRGAGESFLEDELTKTTNGRTNAELWAEFFMEGGNDEFRVVGNNAELVKNIFMSEGVRRVLSVGSGTCLLDRKMKQAGYEGEVVNMDINQKILELAKELYPQIGEIKQGRASNLPLPDESFDAIDCSFMLDMTKLFDNPTIGSFPDINDIERVKILSEINRVLKPGGTLVITLSDSVLENESFVRFLTALTKNFGFQVKDPYLGASFTSDTKPKKRLGWILTLEKTGPVNLDDFDPNDLIFLTDDRIRISSYKGENDLSNIPLKVGTAFFRAKKFEIHNPLSDLIVTSDGVMEDPSEVKTQSDLIEILPEADSVETIEPTSNPLELDKWKRLSENFARELISQSSERSLHQIASQIGPLLDPARWEWWKRTVRTVQVMLEDTYTHYGMNEVIAHLNTWEEAQIILARVFLGSSLYLYDLEGLSSQRLSKRLAQTIGSHIINTQRAREVNYNG